MQSKGYFTRAHDALQEGVEVVKKCLKIEPDLVSVWKLMGDLYTFNYHVPNTDFKAKIANLVLGNSAYPYTHCYYYYSGFMSFDIITDTKRLPLFNHRILIFFTTEV